jgi:hypothetical protein
MTHLTRAGLERELELQREDLYRVAALFRKGDKPLQSLRLRIRRYGAACRALGEYDGREQAGSDRADAIHAAYALGFEKGKAVGREEEEQEGGRG